MVAVVNARFWVVESPLSQRNRNFDFLLSYLGSPITGTMIIMITQQQPINMYKHTERRSYRMRPKVRLRKGADSGGSFQSTNQPIDRASERASERVKRLRRSRDVSDVYTYIILYLYYIIYSSFNRLVGYYSKQKAPKGPPSSSVTHINQWKHTQSHNTAQYVTISN
jgi:hypothetical protein